MTANAEYVSMCDYEVRIYYGIDLNTAEFVIISEVMQTLFGHTD